MPDFKLIDSHQHVFWHGRDDVGLVADMDAHNIEQAWLLTWDEPGADTNNVHMGQSTRAIKFSVAERP